MRKRLVLGNTLATLFAGGFVAALSALGLGWVGAGLLGALVLVTLTSLLGIRILNDLLRRLSQVEEAVLRATYGEPDVRLGAIEPPFDGIAYRLDSLFAMVEQASAVDSASADSAPADADDDTGAKHVA